MLFELLTEDIDVVKINLQANKHLIGISLGSALLVLWLSAIFWMDAYAQHRGASQLQISTQPEDTLFRLARSLGKERALLHSILTLEKPDDNILDALHNTSVQSKKLMLSAIDETRLSRQTTAFRLKHQYDNQAIETLILSLTDGFERMSHASSIVYPQIANHPKDRDSGMQIQLFDAYGNLIQQVNNLRLRLHFLPLKNYHEVIATHSLKNAIWDLSESVRQRSSLLSQYLIASENGSFSSTNKDGLIFRIYQQTQHGDHAAFEIEELSENTGIDDSMEVQFKNLVADFTTGYRSVEIELMKDLASGKTPDITLEEWQTMIASFQQATDNLANEMISHTLNTAKRIGKSAINTLILDTLLVLLCIGMALSSTGIAKRVQYQATHDDLTKLPNRRYFARKIQEYIGRASLHQEILALLTIDLNRFKVVNDTLGHAIGDSLLMQVTERIKSCTDERMFMARMGGDEFALLFAPNQDGEAISLAEDIVKKLEQTFTIEEGLINIGTSIGISYYPQDAVKAEDLLISSDYAMFFAKRDGKKEGVSTIQSYNREMAEEFANRLTIERDLAIAIEENQLELHYQPQFNLEINQVDAVEALVRWNHPVRGNVPPDSFICVAEECGLMPAVGKWVFEEACKQSAIWQQETDFNLRIAINVSIHQIMQPTFVHDVLSAIESNGIGTDSIEIELTESVFMGDSDWVISSLSQLRDAGIKIALDDFGTGYSSLSQLQDLPINTLKIDRSFISNLSSEKRVAHSVTATIATIAGHMGLETVAEGVEYDFQLQQVASLGINVVQGFFYSKPVTGAEVITAITALNNDSQNMQNAA